MSNEGSVKGYPGGSYLGTAFVSSLLTHALVFKATLGASAIYSGPKLTLRVVKGLWGLGFNGGVITPAFIRSAAFDQADRVERELENDPASTLRGTVHGLLRGTVGEMLGKPLSEALQVTGWAADQLTVATKSVAKFVLTGGKLPLNDDIRVPGLRMAAVFMSHNLGLKHMRDDDMQYVSKELPNRWAGRMLGLKPERKLG